MDLYRYFSQKIVNLISRGIVTLSDSGRHSQTLQIKMAGGELKDEIDHLEPYGFTARPHNGAECAALFLDGDKSHGVVIVAADRRYRLKNLQHGEVAIYTDEGDCIHFKRDNRIEVSTGSFIVSAKEKVVLQSPKIIMEGNTFQASASSSVQFITPILSVSGEIADKTGTMSSVRQIYNGHTHIEHDSGVTQKPNLQMG